MAIGKIATLDAVNTATVMDAKPTNEGGTVAESLAATSLDAIKNTQLTAGFTGNLFQEVNTFIGEVAKVYAIAPRPAMVRIRDVLNAYLTQSPVGTPAS